LSGRARPRGNLVPLFVCWLETSAVTQPRAAWQPVKTITGREVFGSEVSAKANLKTADAQTAFRVTGLTPDFCRDGVDLLLRSEERQTAPGDPGKQRCLVGETRRGVCAAIDAVWSSSAM
ncbi:MAG: hypothetical protein ACXWVQ_11005, partial [Methyloceanibacter sp.]